MEKGLKLLFSIYWNDSIWSHQAPTAEDYEQAKREGYMFDPAPVLTHDETLTKLGHVLKKISATDVANAFVYSLSTRALQYRSALGSYYYALAIPEHNYSSPGFCRLCNWTQLSDTFLPEIEVSEYNTFNFERYKWGGVRHTSPEYALFDLDQFLLLPKVKPSEGDWNILKSIFHAMNELPPSKKAGAYRELITKKKLLKSNKDEVAVLLDILGICGILSSAEAPCYCDHFVDVWHRAPHEHTNDYTYPVNSWHVSDGVNEERFLKVFGFSYRDL